MGRGGGCVRCRWRGRKGELGVYYQCIRMNGLNDCAKVCGLWGKQGRVGGVWFGVRGE